MPGQAATTPNLPRRSAMKIAFACAGGLLLVVAALVLCINVISKEVKASLTLFMEETAEVESANLSAIIEGNFNILHGASAFVTAENIDDDAALLDRMREVVDSGAFSRIEVVGLDGHGVAYDTTLHQLPDQDYLGEAYVQAAFEGGDCVTDPIDDSWSGESMVVFAVPVYSIKHSGGHPIGALVGFTSADAFTRTIDASLFDGNGYVHVIDSEGAILFRSHSGFDDKGNVLSMEDGRTGSAAETRNSLAQGVGGTASFVQSDGTPMLALYQPIGNNDWFVDVVVSNAYLEGQIRAVVLPAIAMAGFVIGIVALLMFAILRTRRSKEHALANAALTDSLTNLDNELAFKRKSASRSEYFNGGYRLVLFNLVNFSLFNTVFGYRKGSEAICTIGGILSDGRQEDELVARLSGDRFLLLAKATDPEADEKRLLSIMDAIDEAVQPRDTQYEIASQCCVYQLKREDAERDINLIVQDLGVPLVQAKEHMGDRIILFNERDVAAANRTRRIEAIMSSALSQEEFIAYFQPQYDIPGKPVLCGAEALVRWKSPELGLVTPGEFVPVFERNGSIDLIDRYMLERACIRLREWLDAGLRCVPVSVNLSRRNLFSSDLVARVKQIVDAYRIPYRLIKFELTESIVSENEEQLVTAVHELKSNGFKVSLDDFGTGYSAFSALIDISFDTVKLDRALFGDSMETEQGSKAVAGVIELLDQLGFETLAEGIESPREVSLLRTWGCQVVQGFTFGRPVPADDFLRGHLLPAQGQLRDAEASQPQANPDASHRRKED